MTCNQLIKENKKVIIKFEEFIKAKTENPNDDDNYEYIESYCHKLYTQINETIIALDIKKCSIIEKDRLYKQFEELHNLYFIKLDANTNYFGWSIVENHSQDFFDYEMSFIDPNKFTSDYIIEIKNKLGFNHSKKIKTESNKKEPWFAVGIKYADGSAYKVYDKFQLNKKREDVTKLLFGNEYLPLYEQYFYGNFKKYSGNQFDIFKRPKADEELKKVIKHCKNNNIVICEKFKEECSKLFGNNILV
jgi:hypothetical protein